MRLLQWGYGVYAVLALGAVALVFAPFVLLLPALSLRRHAGRGAVRLAMALIFVPLRVRGLENLPAGPCIVVSNHASYLDGPLLTAALPARFTFVVQHGAANWAFVGRIIRRMGVSFVNRGAARSGASQTRGLIRRLLGGESFAMFPEGTFRKEPALLPFRKGAFLMAARASVPVVPAVIRGTRRLYGEDQTLPRHSAVEIELFPPLHPRGRGREAVLSLRDTARTVVLKHCGEPDAGKQGAADE